MVQLVTADNRHRHTALLEHMHRERKRVFVDLLKWDVPHDDQFEVDQFDTDDAEYLILSDPVSGRHTASMRLLRTDAPHILGSIFPNLCERAVPSAADIREVTRLCVSPALTARQRLMARNTLIRGMVEYGLLTGLRAFTGVAEMSWLSQILSAGWDCRPLGMPQMIEGSLIGALIIHIEPNTLKLFVDSWRCASSDFRVIRTDWPIAA